MQRNILEYLEKTVQEFPDKIAFANDTELMTFRQLSENAKAIGSFLIGQAHEKEPVVVFMGKRPRTIATFMGVLYAGCYYVPIDEEMPKQRIELIFQSLGSMSIICDSETKSILESYNYNGKLYGYDEIIKTVVNDKALEEIRSRQIDTDPVYIVFTSGSTGIPKGVVACHRSVIDYIDNLVVVMGFDNNTVFGNQAPLYVDGCLKDAFSTIKLGATAYLIPKKLFMFPLKLAEYLNNNKINTICWVASAISLLSSFGVLEKETPKYLKTIAFGSEVFPIKQLQIYKKYLPNARYFNLYGPTEATGMSCYYEVKRDFELDEVIPIGKPFDNTEIILLDENKKRTKFGEPGEICIRGTSVTLGYYKDFEKTAKVFIQNPLNDLYPEVIYCTGDMGRYNEFGELIYISRKDNQIKHMGYRIELNEIELAANMMDKVKSACCIFDDVKKKILLFYSGDIAKDEIINHMKEKLPRYMIPNVIEQVESMPFTLSGKINRMQLKETYLNRKENNNG
ncbi:MAG TPA: AMP-dependent synthetase [Clostridiales bacterium]|nr:AMP-dependent synthetase [Clostridiales bacterium]